MYFRRSLGLGLLLCITTSCSYFFKNEPQRSNVYQLTLGEKAEVSCVKDNSRLLKQYFNIEGDDQQIASDLQKMKRCLKDAVLLFAKHTQGAQKDAYSAQEVHDFLTIAFDSYSYPLDFMEQAFLLKFSLLGGDEFAVSKKEVQQLPLFIDFIYDSLATLSSDRRFLFSKVPSTDLKGFETAAARFQKVVDSFNKLPRKTSGLFDYDGAVRLAQYFFSEDADMDHWGKTFILVNSLQALLSVGKEGSIEIQKLPNVLSNLSQLFLGYMQFHKFVYDEYVLKDLSTVFTFPGLLIRIVDHPNVFTDQKIAALNATQEKLLTPLKNAILQAPKKIIPLTYVSELVFTLSKIGSIPDYIQVETLQKMIPQLFGRWLTAQGCDNCDVESFKAENVDVLKGYIQEWSERQLWMNKRKADLDAKITRKFFVRSEYRKRTQRSSNINSFLSVLAQVSHVHWDKYVVIGDNTLTYKDLAIFNQLYTLGHLFVRPFNNNSSKTNLSEYYLDSEQAQNFYQWLRPLAIDLKLGDPRSRTTGSQALTEINLFGSNSKDPKKLDFAEALEYFEMAISTGLKSVEIMKNQFVECRLPNEPLDVFDYQRFDAKCYRPLFYKQHEELMLLSMPKLIYYLNNHSKADRRLYLNYLERAARQGLIVDEPFETDAFRLMGAISQYSESLFLRFDTDKNDILSVDEINKGFKHIVPNIRELIKPLIPKDLVNQLYKTFPNFEQDIISYIFVYDKIPEFLLDQSKATGANLLIFKGQTQFFPSKLKRMEISREQILLVISALSSISRSSRIQTLNQLFFDYELEFDKGLTNIDIKVSNSIVDKLSQLVQCSDKKETELRQWIFDNQDKYWKAELTLAQAKVGSTELRLDRRDIPQKISAWQESVTKKFIELLLNKKSIGSHCSLPFMEEVHQISNLQEVKTCTSVPSLGGMGGGVTCEERTPY